MAPHIREWEARYRGDLTHYRVLQAVRVRNARLHSGSQVQQMRVDAIAGILVFYTRNSPVRGEDSLKKQRNFDDVSERTGGLGRDGSCSRRD